MEKGPYQSSLMSLNPFVHFLLGNNFRAGYDSSHRITKILVTCFDFDDRMLATISKEQKGVEKNTQSNQSM